MKKLLSISLFLCAASSYAQDTYMNEQMLNNSADVIGTSRYVGMGGALGALGADMSVIGWNPAGIGLYRKSDLAITFGGLWNKNRVKEENRGAVTFDQIGFVYNLKTESDIFPYFNFAVNYQKKKNFFSNFNAESDTNYLLDISQADQLAELASFGYDTNYNLAGLAVDNGMLSSYQSDGKTKYSNKYYGDYNTYTHHGEGSLRSWDFNVSTNVQDRAFFGITFGVDNIEYDAWTNYFEARHFKDDNDVEYRGNYSIWNDYKVTGYGFNFKLGGIVLPFENNPFRVGFAIESPTWYKLKSSVLMNYADETNNPVAISNTIESYLPFNIQTPWKFRASMGSTVSNKFAWDVDYEFAKYNSMKQRYPYNDSFSGTKDVAMNDHMYENLKGVHTIRAGVEVRPITPLAFRLGYNFSTSPYEKNATFDQALINSTAMDYITRTNYMITKPTHILSLGMGYRWRKFYVDLAYKIRHQKADFYAFDDSFTTPNTDFSNANPDMVNIRLASVPVDLTRHSITCTLGFKF